MRLFDELDMSTQNEILVSCIRYAKGEISEFNLPASTDVLALAVQYDTMFFLDILDFGGMNTENIASFTGVRPVKRPQ